MKSKKIILLVMSIVTIICLVTLITLVIKNKTSVTDVKGTTQNLNTVLKQASFKTYKPSNDLPNGYSINAAKAIYDNGIISYEITTPTNKSITITQQERPVEVTNTLFSGERITTSLGKVTIFTSPEGTSAAIITTAETLILLNSNQRVAKNEILIILESLK